MIRHPRSLSVAFLAALVAGVSACASPTYLARVNEQPVTGKDVKDEFTAAHSGHASFLASEVEVRKFLDLVVDDKLLVQEAYRLELDKQPDIRAAVDEYAGKLGSEYFVKKEIDEKGKATPEEIKAAWEANTSRVYRARQIVVDTRSEAESVYLELLRGADFEAEARACSISGSRIYGGNLPYLGWGALDPKWEEAVFPMQPGELSAPFETPDGWEIVQLVEIQGGERPELSKVMLRIDGILKRRKLAALKQATTEMLWTKYHVKKTDVDLGPEGLHEALSKTPDAKIASWDGGSLTFKDFSKEVDWNEVAGLLPGRFRSRMEVELRRQVNEPLARLEAKERHYEKVPEVADPVRRYQEGLMQRALYADFVLKKVTVTDADMKAWYDAHAKQLVEPEKRRVSQIVLASKDDAVAVRKEISDGGKPFEMMVTTKSTDTGSKSKMGDLGWVKKTDAKGEFESVFQLAEGEVSQPLESKFGWHLMKVNKIQPEKPLDYEEAKEQIRKAVLEQKQREARAVWVKKLRDDASIKISNSGIRAFVKENAAEADKAAAPPPPSHEPPAGGHPQAARKENS